MQTQSHSHAISPTKQKIATIFRLVGWIAFWVELGLAVASGFVLLVAISGPNFATETNTGIGIGVFWAFCGILAVWHCC